jgi:hypothetical protein
MKKLLLSVCLLAATSLGAQSYEPYQHAMSIINKGNPATKKKESLKVACCYQVCTLDSHGMIDESKTTYDVHVYTLPGNRSLSQAQPYPVFYEQNGKTLRLLYEVRVYGSKAFSKWFGMKTKTKFGPFASIADLENTLAKQQDHFKIGRMVVKELLNRNYAGEMRAKLQSTPRLSAFITETNEGYQFHIRKDPKQEALFKDVIREELHLFEKGRESVDRFGKSIFGY